MGWAKCGPPMGSFTLLGCPGNKEQVRAFLPSRPQPRRRRVFAIVEVRQAHNGSCRQRLELEELGLRLVIEAHDAWHGSSNARESGINATVRLVADNLVNATGIVSEHDVRRGGCTAEQRSNGSSFIALPEKRSHQQEGAGNSIVEDGMGCGIYHLGHFAHSHTETFLPQWHVGSRLSRRIARRNANRAIVRCLLSTQKLRSPPDYVLMLMGRMAPPRQVAKGERDGRARFLR